MVDDIIFVFGCSSNFTSLKVYQVHTSYDFIFCWEQIGIIKQVAKL